MGTAPHPGARHGSSSRGRSAAAAGEHDVAERVRHRGAHVRHRESNRRDVHMSPVATDAAVSTPSGESSRMVVHHHGRDRRRDPSSGAGGMEQQFRGSVRPHCAVGGRSRRRGTAPRRITAQRTTGRRSARSVTAARRTSGHCSRRWPSSSAVEPSHSARRGARWGRSQGRARTASSTPSSWAFSSPTSGRFVRSSARLAAAESAAMQASCVVPPIPSLSRSWSTTPPQSRAPCSRCSAWPCTRQPAHPSSTPGQRRHRCPPHRGRGRPVGAGT